MSIEYIRKTYGVPAKRGGRVIYTGSQPVRHGTIKSARGGYGLILLDGDKWPKTFHPTWWSLPRNDRPETKHSR